MIATDLLVAGLTNAALATLLAVAAWLLTRLWTNPYFASVAWLVVLLKLVTPPLVVLPVEFGVENHESRIERSASDHQQPAGEILETSEAWPEAAPMTTRLGESHHTAASIVPVEAPKPKLIALHVQIAPVARPSVAATVPKPEPVAIPAAGEPSVAKWPSQLPELISIAPHLLVGIWLAGSLSVAILTIVRVARFRRLLRTAATENESVAMTARRVAEWIGLRRGAAVRMIEANVGPMVWAGSLRPIVLVPEPLWNAIGEGERETLLAHELAHIVRRDHWVRRLEAIAMILYWWLPTAWLAVRRREAAAEACCDAIVLATYPDRPQAYAEALFQAVTLHSTGRVAVLASGLGRTSDLKERLAMIVRNQVPNQPRRLVKLVLTGSALCVLAISARFVQAERDEKPVGDRGVVAMPQVHRTPTADMYGGESLASDTVGYAAPAFGGADDVDPFSRIAQGFLLSATAESERDTGPPAAVRDKILAGLEKVIRAADEPVEVKVQALQSYGRLAEGESAETLLLDVAKTSDDARVKLAAADALQGLGSTKGREMMWSLLESNDLDTRQLAIRLLDRASAVPPNVESVQRLAALAAAGMTMNGGMGMMPGGAMDQQDSIQRLLRRLIGSGDGIRRLVEAIEVAPQDLGYQEAVGGFAAQVGDEYPGFAGPLSADSVLESILGEAAPASDDIAEALVEALSSKNSGVRGAAARALGNLAQRSSGRRGPSGMSSSAMSGRGGRARPLGAAATSPAPSQPKINATQTPPSQDLPFSSKVRDELIKSLTAALEDKDAGAESRSAALRSLGKLAEGGEHARAVLEIARTFLTEKESSALKQAAAQVVHDLSKSAESQEVLWEALPSVDLDTRAEFVRQLGALDALPPDAKSVVTIARVRLKLASSLNLEKHAAAHEAAGRMLERLGTTGDGVRRLIDAVEADDIFGESGMFDVTDLLLAYVADITPMSDDVAVALAEALSNGRDVIRRAAATALGNTTSKPSKTGAAELLEFKRETVRFEYGRFLVLRYRDIVIALRAETDPERGQSGITYTWHTLDEDGKPRPDRGGRGMTQEGESGAGVGTIAMGPLKLKWSQSGEHSGWLYLRESKAPLEIYPVQFDRLEDITFDRQPYTSDQVESWRRYN